MNFNSPKMIGKVTEELRKLIAFSYLERNP